MAKPKPQKITPTKKTAGKKTKKRTLKDRPREIMLTPHQMKNYIMNNSLQDWLELYHDDREKIGKRRPRSRSQSRKSVGDKFREHVFQYVQKHYAEHVVVLQRPDIRDMSGTEAAGVLDGKETLEYMKKRIPIIINAQLINRYMGTCDVADMLVRSDYVRELFTDTDTGAGYRSDFPESSCEHYVVVAVRYGKLGYCVDGVTVRNNPSMRYWKTKLYAQTMVLARYQGYAQSCAVILGSGSTWVDSSKRKHESHEFSPGVVQFDGKDMKICVDNYVEAESWLTAVRAESAAKWTLAPVPSVSELYANAKLSVYDTPWAPVIQDIAEEQDEITRLWNCSVAVRDRTHAKGIRRLSDVKSAEDLGFKSGTKTSMLLDRYLSHDYDDTSEIPLNLSVTWTTLDFESLPVAEIRTYDRASFTDSCIYLASVGNRQFGISRVAMSLEDTERAVAKGVYQALSEVEKDAGPREQYQIFCWGQAEARYMWQLERKYPEYPIATKFAANLVDLHEMFVENQIILPGQLNNTLSSAAKALGVTQKVPINTNELAEIVLSDGSETDKEERDVALKTLLEYNLNDVKVLEEIIGKIVYEQQGDGEKFDPAVEKDIVG